MPHKTLTLLATAALAATISACAVLSADEPPMACYWLSNVTNQWEAMPGVDTRGQCARLDSCSGGKGESGGGCYKWSSGADGPQIPW
ncbi:hypothetical protein U91I_03724 [alpha proteobacterium U9-1i]|nr:hypothetical protein U91I_03724 [alpha proteobacterium U9-1i]